MMVMQWYSRKRNFRKGKLLELAEGLMIVEVGWKEAQDQSFIGAMEDFYSGC